MSDVPPRSAKRQLRSARVHQRTARVSRSTAAAAEKTAAAAAAKGDNSCGSAGGIVVDGTDAVTS